MPAVEARLQAQRTKGAAVDRELCRILSNELGRALLRRRQPL